MKKNVFVFSRLAPEHLERLQRQFNVRVLEPKQGDIDAQYAAALPDTHGMIGVGRIGAAIARRGRFGFGMQVLYHGNNRKPELEQELGARFLGFDELLGEADFVCVVVPLGAQTRQLIGARELGLMKPSAILVNVARGQVVDEAALVAALREKRILGAGLDVYEKEPLAESPLFALDNVVTLPHIGSATHETRRAMAERALQNFEAALRGERPLDLVNPQVWRRG